MTPHTVNGVVLFIQQFIIILRIQLMLLTDSCWFTFNTEMKLSTRRIYFGPNRVVRFLRLHAPLLYTLGCSFSAIIAVI